LEEIENSSRPQGPSPGYNLAFWEYSKANALATKGWCLRKMAKYHSETELEKVGNLHQSCLLYLEASKLVPDDDEWASTYLMWAMSSAFRGRAPLKTTIPMLESFRACIPKMKKVWEFSAQRMSGRDNHYQLYLNFEVDAKKALRKKQMKMITQAAPIHEKQDRFL